MVYVPKNRQNIFRFEKLACVFTWAFRLERKINDFQSFRGGPWNRIESAINRTCKVDVLTWLYEVKLDRWKSSVEFWLVLSAESLNNWCEHESSQAFTTISNKVNIHKITRLILLYYHYFTRKALWISTVNFFWHRSNINNIWINFQKSQLELPFLVFQIHPKLLFSYLFIPMQSAGTIFGHRVPNWAWEIAHEAGSRHRKESSTMQ